MMYFVVF